MKQRGPAGSIAASGGIPAWVLGWALPYGCGGKAVLQTAMAGSRLGAVPDQLTPAVAPRTVSLRVTVKRQTSERPSRLALIILG